MKLKPGNIYKIKYNKYERDPYPLILVLYEDKHLVHAINLNYLTPALTNKVIEMVAQIAQKQLKFTNMYNHYHGWMKKKLPLVIRNGYRTYALKSIGRTTVIANGYWGAKNLLVTLLPKAKGKVVIAKSIKKQIKKQKQKRSEDLNLATLDAKLHKYVQTMSKTAPKKKNEDDKYTEIKG